jgi:ABC-type lipoprotein release transport system permease subunit
MKHIVPLMRYVALAILALLGIALGGAAGALLGVALAYLLIAPITVVAAAIVSTPYFDPMGIGFPVRGLRNHGLCGRRRCFDIPDQLSLSGDARKPAVSRLSYQPRL